MAVKFQTSSTSECLSDFKNGGNPLHDPGRRHNLANKFADTSQRVEVDRRRATTQGCNRSCYSYLLSLPQVDSEETWLPAILPDDTIFTCICWSATLFVYLQNNSLSGYFICHWFLVLLFIHRHVDWDGLLTVSTEAHQEGLRSSL